VSWLKTTDSSVTDVIEVSKLKRNIMSIHLSISRSVVIPTCFCACVYALQTFPGQ